MVMAVLLAVSAVGNCKSTKLVASVKSPTYAGQHFQKVLVIGMSDNPAIRTDFEDAMADRLKRRASTPFPATTSCCGPSRRRWIPTT